jgi:hypothetical protein
VLMMPMSVCLMNLPHKKAAVSRLRAQKQACNSSATSSQTGTLSSGKARRLLSEKHRRASTSGQQWRARVVDVVGGVLVGGCYGGSEKQKQPRASLLVHALAPVILPAWLLAGGERPVDVTASRAPGHLCLLGRGWVESR